MATKKKAGLHRPMPLERHIEHIVIWEGNYTSDLINIGTQTRFL